VFYGTCLPSGESRNFAGGGKQWRIQKFCRGREAMADPEILQGREAINVSAPSSFIANKKRAKQCKLK